MALGVLVALDVPANTHCHLPNEQMKSIKGVSLAKWEMENGKWNMFPLIIKHCRQLTRLKWKGDPKKELRLMDCRLKFLS